MVLCVVKFNDDFPRKYYDKKVKKHVLIAMIMCSSKNYAFSPFVRLWFSALLPNCHCRLSTCCMVDVALTKEIERKAQHCYRVLYAQEKIIARLQSLSCRWSVWTWNRRSENWVGSERINISSYGIIFANRICGWVHKILMQHHWFWATNEFNCV